MNYALTASELRGPLYLDASALGKLIVAEAESEALESFLEPWPERASSKLATIELGRLLLRQRPGEDPAPRLESIMGGIVTIAISDAIVLRAGAIQPPRLRSLDAIHLATALSIPGLAGMVVYDGPLAEAARYHGLTVFSPGAEI
ncbi:MAG: type II toxin-antitoxin system VapC family toxin [Terriglobales bacterium]